MFSRPLKLRRFLSNSGFRFRAPAPVLGMEHACRDGPSTDAFRREGPVGDADWTRERARVTIRTLRSKFQPKPRWSYNESTDRILCLWSPTSALAATTSLINFIGYSFYQQ